MHINKASAIDLFIVIIMYFDITIPLNNFKTKDWHEWKTKLITRNQIKNEFRRTNYELKFFEWSLALNE